jgi:hypothetical protein
VKPPSISVDDLGAETLQGKITASFLQRSHRMNRLLGMLARHHDLMIGPVACTFIQTRSSLEYQTSFASPVKYSGAVYVFDTSGGVGLWPSVVTPKRKPNSRKQGPLFAFNAPICHHRSVPLRSKLYRDMSEAAKRADAAKDNRCTGRSGLGG